MLVDCGGRGLLPVSVEDSGIVNYAHLREDDDHCVPSASR